ncbi:MAG: sporulation inhibitor of replication protein SirA [Bacilli bacterium]|nr:sporulation inhibitor of replication protein SirA [Bacilli bacterium]
MRRFYIFSIREELLTLYKDNPGNLYKILESIYSMKDEEFTYGYNLFKQICISIDNLELSNRLYLTMHNDLVYTKIDNEHIINNLYKDEVSILKIGKSHIILDSNNSYSSFFAFLNKYNKNYFVCDFNEGDYFFLNSIELIVH